MRHVLSRHALELLLQVRVERLIVRTDLIGQITALDLRFLKHRIEHLAERRHASRHGQVNDLDARWNRHAGIANHEQVLVAERRNAARKLRMQYTVFLHRNLSSSLSFASLFVDMVIIHH